MLFLISCMGFDQSTNVDELRVMAIKSEPLEIRISDYSSPMIELPQNPSDEEEEDSTPKVHIVVANPTNEELHMAVWLCTNLGEGCLEADFYADTPSAWITLIEPTETSVSLPIPLNPVWATFNTPEPQLSPLTAVWVLTCVASECTLLENAFNGNWDLDVFRDPFSLGTQIPLTNSSLASKQLLVSNFEAMIPRIQNPIMTPLFDELPTISDQESLDLRFELELFQQDSERASIYGYSTIGGFSANSLVNNSISTLQQQKTLTWFPPTEITNETGDLFVIVNDGLGGVNFWTSQITTEQMD